MIKICTSKAEITLHEKNIVKINVMNDVCLEADDILEINKAQSFLIKDNYYRVLHVCGINSSVSKEARDLLSNKDISKNRLAKAIIINSLAQKIVVNFFIKFNKPPYPTKLFNTESEALRWLDEIKE
ncbi:MAG: DUF7793 family protein [Bacteroidia bacterium]